VKVSQVSYRAAQVLVELHRGIDIVRANIRMKIRLLTGRRIVSQFPIPLNQDVKFMLTKLSPHTKYTISIAVGDGTIFTSFRNAQTFKTKGINTV
jgi:hypothetical protein